MAKSLAATFVEDEQQPPSLAASFKEDEPVQDREASTDLAGLITGRPNVSKEESAVRGGLQGATLGFGDEAAAAIETGVAQVPGLRDVAQKLHDPSLPPINANDASQSAVTDLVARIRGEQAPARVGYQERREALRQKNALAALANPKTYFGAELGGGFLAPIPGSSLAQGATLLPRLGQAAKTGAKIGAAAGLGTSEADLTKGELGAAANDVLRGAVVGAVAAPVATAVGSGLARTGQRLVKDIGKGTAKSTRLELRELESKLADTLTELPTARKALMTKARTNPESAMNDIDSTLTPITKENDLVFQAIQDQHGGVGLGDVVGRLTRLEVRLNKQGHGTAADAAGRVRDDLLKRYGYEGKWTPDMKLTAEQIRNIRNDMGAKAFPNFNPEQVNTQRAALGQIYGEYNKAIEAVAAKTKGVDLPALKTRNRQISTLIPVRDALEERVENAAISDKTLFQKAKEVPVDILRRSTREIGYRLGGYRGAPSSGAPAGAVQENRRRLQALSPAMAQ
jgi:hypothetical protein